MPEKTLAGVTVEVDDQGYLTQPRLWTRELARELAREEGIQELTVPHWQVIEFMRRDWEEKGASPNLRRISKLSGIGTKELYALFPGGPGKKAAKIAGVPKPQGCV